MKMWWNVLDLLEDNVLFSNCDSPYSHARHWMHLFSLLIDRSVLGGLHTSESVELVCVDMTELSIHMSKLLLVLIQIHVCQRMCVCVLILDHWITIECNEPQTAILFAWWEEIKEWDFKSFLMEAELMNQSAEGYRFNNIGIIYVWCKLKKDEVYVRCVVPFYFYWGVCFFCCCCCLQRIAI